VVVKGIINLHAPGVHHYHELSTFVIKGITYQWVLISLEFRVRLAAAWEATTDAVLIILELMTIELK
jgi:hypothetical protein